MKVFYCFSVFVCISVGHSFTDGQPLGDESRKEFIRTVRSPTKHHKPLFGGGFLFSGGKPTEHGSQGVVNNNYITNVNNYGPGGHGGPGNYGHGGSSSGSVAYAGGHGGQSQSQAAAFSVGPHGAAFAQSQSQSGGHGKGGLFDFFDY